MDVAKYAADLEDLIARVPGFLQDQLDESKSKGRDPGRTARSRQFSKDLASLNNNPFVRGLFPFVVFVPNAPHLSVDQVQGLLSDAKDFGLSDEVLVVDRDGYQLLFFSYAAEPYMPTLIELRGLAYSNLEGNGLVMRDLHLVGLFSADPFTLRVFAKDAEKALKARRH